MQTCEPEAKQRKMFIYADMHPILWQVITRHVVSIDHAKVKALTDMLPSKTQRELQFSLGIGNYLSKFSSMI